MLKYGFLRYVSIRDLLSSNPSSQALSMEDTTMSCEDEKPVTEAVPSKPHKAAQPGEKAPEDAIKFWKENGFSRLTSILLASLLLTTDV